MEMATNPANVRIYDARSARKQKRNLPNRVMNKLTHKENASLYKPQLNLLEFTAVLIERPRVGHVFDSDGGVNLRRPDSFAALRHGRRLPQEPL